MKKLLSAVMSVLLFAGSAFALNFSADGNFTIPMNAWYDTWEVSNVIKTTTKNLDYGFGFDAGGQAMLTNQFGARVAFGFSWPQGDNWTNNTTNSFTNSTTTTSGTTKYNSDNTSLFAINLFVGPVINIKNTKKYVIYVNPGFYMQTRIKTVTQSDNSKTTTSTSDFGLGAEIDARYDITRKCYVRASCPLIWTFSSKDNSSGSTHDVQKFSFAPHFGVGYKF
ncbi:MAG: outer membrane beta-barrel protein [Treponema sp.]|nr:outer membrane beta-barrel protein [Treponema sp.]